MYSALFRDAALVELLRKLVFSVGFSVCFLITRIYHIKCRYQQATEATARHHLICAAPLERSVLTTGTQDCPGSHWSGPLIAVGPVQMGELYCTDAAFHVVMIPQYFFFPSARGVLQPDGIHHLRLGFVLGRRASIRIRYHGGPSGCIGLARLAGGDVAVSPN